MHAPIIDINLGSINPKIRALCMQEVKESLEFARRGATAVVVHAAPAFWPCRREMVPKPKRPRCEGSG